MMIQCVKWVSERKREGEGGKRQIQSLWKQCRKLFIIWRQCLFMQNKRRIYEEIFLLPYAWASMWIAYV